MPRQNMPKKAEFTRIDLDTPPELSPDEALRDTPLKFSGQVVYLAVPIFIYENRKPGEWYPSETKEPGLVHDLSAQTGISDSAINISIKKNVEDGFLDVLKNNDGLRKHKVNTAARLTESGVNETERTIRENPDLIKKLGEFAYQSKMQIANGVLADIKKGFADLGLQQEDFKDPAEMTYSELKAYLPRLQGVLAQIHNIADRKRIRI